MRHSNVYEERSLGLYEDDSQPMDQENSQSLPIIVEKPKRGPLRRRATAAVQEKVKRSITSSFHGVGVQPPPPGSNEHSRTSFIRQQIRGQLAHDLWWLVLPLLIIMIIETDHFLERPLVYSLFNVLFEVVSAYGCVGLSVGFPGANYSFSGKLHNGSKIVLCLVMLRGRHRGLPVAVDKAVRLPGEKLHKEEQEDSKIRRSRTMDRISSRDI